MSNNNHKKWSCEFAGQVIAYLYDEIEREEKVKFETHIKDCSFCADEYAGLGGVRSTIIEWRNEDFSALATPNIYVPAQEIEKTDSIGSVKGNSWINAIKKLFSLNPILAPAALAFLIVCAGVTLFALNYNSDREIAGEIIDQNAAIAVSPTVEITNKPIEKESNVKDIVVKSTVQTDKTLKINQPQKREKAAALVKSAVKIAENKLPKTSYNAVVDLKETVTEKKTQAVKKRQVPNLTEFADDEDESLRLADLLDDLDTK